MRILMVCQHYWPEHFQITEICEDLVVRGHDVTALVGIPNYPSGLVPDEYRSGKNREQDINGVHIIRVEEIPRKAGAFGLARNYFSYMYAAEAKLKDLQEEFDIIFAYQLSPVFMSKPAMKAKRLLGIPVFLYCADIWPDAIKAMLPNKLNFLMPVVQMVSRSIYRGADMIAVNSRAYIDCFDQMHGIERTLCHYVPQYAEDAYLDMNFDTTPSDKVRFMVIGNIGKLQHMSTLMEAIDLLKRRNDFEFHIVGTGSSIGECKSFVLEHGLQNQVVFHGRHSFDEMPFFYRMADVCLLTLYVSGAPWISSTLPSRLQGYMAAGKPVLAAVEGSAAKVVRDSGCGASVGGTDSKGLATLMIDFIENRSKYAKCGENGRRYYRKHFMKQRYMDDIERLLFETAEVGSNE